jgi:hypothetical protein
MSIKTRILQAERKTKPAQPTQLYPLEMWERGIDTLADALGYEGKRDDFLLLLKETCGQVKP